FEYRSAAFIDEAVGDTQKWQDVTPLIVGDDDFGGQTEVVQAFLHGVGTVGRGGDDDPPRDVTCLQSGNHFIQQLDVPHVDDGAGAWIGRYGRFRALLQRAPGGGQPGVTETRIRFQHGAFGPFVPRVDEYQASGCRQ